MGGLKKYSGYKSYQYLESGKDYPIFKLAKEMGRVPPFTIPLVEPEKRRVNRILDDCVVISLHDHAIFLTEDLTEVFDFNRHGRMVTGYEALSISRMDAVFDNFMNGTATITSQHGWKWSDVIYDLGMRLGDIAHQDMLTRGERVRDILEAKEKGKIALVPCLESATMIENEIDRIDILYGLGVRMMGLVYSDSNSLGSGLKEKSDGGLTYFGRQAIERMNRIGMAVDVSHAGDLTSLEAIKESSKPVFISHAGARNIWNSKRLKPDEVLRACAERGGIIGIEAAPNTTVTRKNRKQSIESVMEHFEYCVDLVGIDHVAFGPDTGFGDHVALHRVASAHLSIKEAFLGEVGEEIDHVEGLENPGENFTNITSWLVKHNYSDEEIKKVLGGNILRILKEVWWP